LYFNLNSSLSQKIGVVIPKGVDDVGDYNRTRRVNFGIKLSFTVLPRSGFSETPLELYREILYNNSFLQNSAKSTQLQMLPVQVLTSNSQSSC